MASSSADPNQRRRRRGRDEGRYGIESLGVGERGGGGSGSGNRNVGRNGGGNGRRYDKEVTVHYDPLISKIITHGPDRRTALSRLRSALRRYELSGPGTNLRFLEGCASHPDFDHDRV